jgi:membrane protease YdiL (CAAX protease family)
VVRRLAIIGALIPSVATVIGIHWLGSGWATILIYHVGAAALLAARRREWELASITRGWRRRMGLGLSALCACAGAAIVILWPFLRFPGGELADSLAAVGLRGSAWVGFVVYYSTLHPVLEELFWRGWLNGPAAAADHPRAHRRPHPCDLLFGLYHLLVLIAFVQWPWAVLTGVILTGMAWTWRAVTRATGGLAIPVVTHAVADLSVMLAAVWLAAGGS